MPSKRARKSAAALAVAGGWYWWCPQEEPQQWPLLPRPYVKVVVGYMMMVLGLVELVLNSERCADRDCAKKEGNKSCWDRPATGLGETELNRLF
jgi:hypothetical protein